MWPDSRIDTTPRPANSPALLTRHPTYHRDKMSPLAPWSELIEYHSPCRIKSLVEGERLAPILRAIGVNPFLNQI